MNPMNPLKLIKSYIAKGFTAKGIVKTMAGNNPMINSLIDMADKGDAQSVEQFAINVMKERGMDFNKEFEEFKKNF